MDAATRETVTWTLGTIIGLAAIIGLLVRLMLLPYLREHLVEPVREVKQQVTENHHENPDATLPDRLDDLHSDVRTLTKVLDGHLASSDQWLTQITAEQRWLRQQLFRLTRKEHRNE
jgi:hypothetical protein